jgi:hypothetical protein
LDLGDVTRAADPPDRAEIKASRLGRQAEITERELQVAGHPDLGAVSADPQGRPGPPVARGSR